VPALLGALRPDDLLVFTADHGCDPTTPSTDHSREYAPLLLAERLPGAPAAFGRDLGVRDTFADVAATVAAHLGVPNPGPGESLLPASALRAADAG
jgi:phosphopentomutase